MRCLFYSFVLLCISTVSALFADSLFLKDQFQKAKSGDFVVLEQDHMITFMHIHTKKDNTILLEEICLPDANLKNLRKNPHFSWSQWFQDGACKNTSWIIYEISLTNGAVLKSYSFTKKCLLNPSQIENFLPTLLNLPFEPIVEQNRKRVGKAPPSGERDKRAFWQPRMIFDGNVIRDVLFDGWKAVWPKDHTPLSGTVIEIYLPKNSKNALPYFPYWLQVSDAIASLKICLIDSGKNAKSPNRESPF